MNANVDGIHPLIAARWPRLPIDIARLAPFP
jgi:hypothetical protein